MLTSMSSLLEYIQSSIYGSQVRSAIVEAIQQCYDDVSLTTEQKTELIDLLDNSGGSE